VFQHHIYQVVYVHSLLFAQQIHEILVSDPAVARKLKFLGSPTIRVNGRDVAGEFGDLAHGNLWDNRFVT